MSTLATTNLKNASSGSNNIVLNTDGTTTIAAPSNIIKSGTAVASTSGVAIDFTGIPSWAKRITLMFSGVSTDGASPIAIRVGAGSIQATGYLGVGMAFSTTNTTAVNRTASFATDDFISAAAVRTGFGVLNSFSGNTWVWTASSGREDAANYGLGGGQVTLSGTLDRIRITTVNGTDTFDAGSINILWEG